MLLPAHTLSKSAHRFRMTAVALTMAALPLFTAPVQAAGLVGDEFQVNSHTSSSKGRPEVAMDADGNFVVVWHSDDQDGSGRGTYGQRYDAMGIRLGKEFRVNTYTADFQDYSAIAMDAEGNFVVVWKSYGQDGSEHGIYGQRYDAMGSRLGKEFRVNSYTSGSQISPDVAMDADGNFVVVWSSADQDGSGHGIYGQRYDAAGTRQGSEFQVNTYTSSDQDQPAVAMDADGDFVVVWKSGEYHMREGIIYGQRYDAAGTPQGSEFQVSTLKSNSGFPPEVAMDAEGNFVVVWDTYGQDGSEAGIYGQRYNKQGAPQGKEFRVSTYTKGEAPEIVIGSGGDFVVVWSDYTLAGSEWDVYARRYNANGTPQGSEFRVNTSTPVWQWIPAIAMNANSDYVVTWVSTNQYDNSYANIFAQRGEATPDRTPNAYDFTDQNDVPVGQLVYSNTPTLKGFDTDTTISVAKGAYRVYSGATTTWGSWRTLPSTINPGDKVQLRTTTASLPSTAKTVTLTTGTRSVDWTVTTAAPDTTPDPFAFSDKTNQPRDVWVLSDIIKPTGFTVPAAISCSGGQYRIQTDGVWGAWTTKPGQLSPGSRVQVRVRSAKMVYTTKGSVLTIGGVSDTFEVTTAP